MGFWIKQIWVHLRSSLDFLISPVSCTLTHSSLNTSQPEGPFPVPQTHQVLSSGHPLIILLENQLPPAVHLSITYFFVQASTQMLFLQRGSPLTSLNLSQLLFFHYPSSLYYIIGGVRQRNACLPYKKERALAGPRPCQLGPPMLSPIAYIKIYFRMNEQMKLVKLLNLYEAMSLSTP